jgi:16S rRNA (adenine1518-N6/adenine1519-N6)-dimethyltransferase
VRRVLLTIQKEVADRIVAQPGNKTYSSISLGVQIAFKPSIAFTIHPGAFYPQPKVTSAVLRLDPLEEPAVPPEQEEAILKLVRSIFTHRRKTLLNALLTGGVSIPKEELQRRLKEAGIDPIRRPETLGLQDLVRLQAALLG